MPYKLVIFVIHLVTILNISEAFIEANNRYPLLSAAANDANDRFPDRSGASIDAVDMFRDTALEPRDMMETFDMDYFFGDDIQEIPNDSMESRPGSFYFDIQPDVRKYGHSRNIKDEQEGMDRDSKFRHITYITKRRPESLKTEWHAHNRRRSKISRFQRNYFPYSNIVRLSAGCTGTLLTPYHVITAAHCVHNGDRYKRNVEMLKVEVPEIIGSRLFYVVEIKVPAMWRKSQTLPEVARGAYDYAVLKLNLPVRGRKEFMHLSLPIMSYLNSNVHFVSFSFDRPHGMVKSTCQPDENLTVMNGNVLLTSCETSDRGSSGSAIFTNKGREGAKIIGILSNTITTTSGSKEFDAIMLLTFQKSLDICSMIYPEGIEYNSCNSISLGSSQRQSGRFRNMPIFG